MHIHVNKDTHTYLHKYTLPGVKVCAPRPSLNSRYDVPDFNIVYSINDDENNDDNNVDIGDNNDYNKYDNIDDDDNHDDDDNDNDNNNE
jgi:hypothetical protein